MKAIKLTPAQVYTLLRMRSGKWLASHDGKRGSERRVEGRHSYRDVNCPSLPVLLRGGYAEFISAKDPLDREKGKWYFVTLTDKGREAIKEELNR